MPFSRCRLYSSTIALSEGNTKQKAERHLKNKADVVIKCLLGQKESELSAYYAQLELYALDS